MLQDVNLMIQDVSKFNDSDHRRWKYQGILYIWLSDLDVNRHKFKWTPIFFFVKCDTEHFVQYKLSIHVHGSFFSLVTE